MPPVIRHDFDTWTKRTSISLGALCIVGMLIPLMVRSQTLFFTDYLEHLPLWTLTPLLAGIAAIVCGTSMRGQGRGTALLVVGILAVICGILIPAAEVAKLMRMGGRSASAMGDSGALLMLLFVGLSLIAGGNRAAKYRPDKKGIKLLVGIGGALVVLGYILPVINGHMLLEGVFEMLQKQETMAIGLLLLLVLTYGVLGVIAFFGNVLHSPLSILARAVTYGFPVVVLVMLVANEAPGEAISMVLIMLLKMMFIYLGIAALLALGIATMAVEMAGGAAGAAGPGESGGSGGSWGGSYSPPSTSDAGDAGDADGAPEPSPTGLDKAE